VTHTAQFDVDAPTRKGVCAIVVTYFPDARFAERIKVAKEQVDMLVVIDNSGNNSPLHQFKELSDDRVHLIFNEFNTGLAAALNLGMTWAKAAGYSWAVLLDQDTTVHGDAVEQLLSIAQRYLAPDRIAAIGSNYESVRSMQSAWTEETSVITSGSLLSIPAFSRIGPFRDEFFVDCVDLEYCLRARASGFKVLRSTNKLMEHEIGNVTRHSILSFQAGTSNHVVIRRYYLARNLTSLIREYSRREPRWVVRMIVNQFKSLLLLCLFEADRRRKLKIYLIGLYDGWKGRFGRDLPELKNGNHRS
jgi:rhamnosyltransferase